MADAQRPKVIGEVVEDAEKEVKEVVEAPKPEPESETPTEHYMRKKGINQKK